MVCLRLIGTVVSSALLVSCSYHSRATNGTLYKLDGNMVNPQQVDESPNDFPGTSRLLNELDFSKYLPIVTQEKPFQPSEKPIEKERQIACLPEPIQTRYSSYHFEGINAMGLRIQNDHLPTTWEGNRNGLIVGEDYIFFSDAIGSDPMSKKRKREVKMPSRIELTKSISDNTGILKQTLPMFTNALIVFFSYEGLAPLLCTRIVGDPKMHVFYLSRDEKIYRVTQLSVNNRTECRDPKARDLIVVAKPPQEPASLYGEKSLKDVIEYFYDEEVKGLVTLGRITLSNE